MKQYKSLPARNHFTLLAIVGVSFIPSLISTQLQENSGFCYLTHNRSEKERILIISHTNLGKRHKNIRP